MKKTWIGILALLGCLLVGCRTTPPPNYSEMRHTNSPSERLERSMDMLARQVETDVDSLERTARLVSTNFNKDSRATRDNITGFPGWIARDFENGSDSISRDVSTMGAGIESSVNRFPAEVSRFFYLLW